MNVRMSAVVIVFATTMSATFGDESIPKEKLSETRIATELDQYETNVRSLDRRFQEAIGRLEESYRAERESMRETLAKTLLKEKETLVANGELDQAILIRNQIETIESTEVAPPHRQVPQADDARSYTPSNRRSISGTWRWNNGADIRNLDHGKTSGNGTWKLVDAREQTYEFQWTRIPPDRVKLSANGRVLEGTKANDLNFRVWAVRID